MRFWQFRLTLTHMVHLFFSNQNKGRNWRFRQSGELAISGHSQIGIQGDPSRSLKKPGLQAHWGLHTCFSSQRNLATNETQVSGGQGSRHVKYSLGPHMPSVKMSNNLGRDDYTVSRFQKRP